jgi:hypothetical protein
MEQRLHNTTSSNNSSIQHNPPKQPLQAHMTLRRDKQMLERVTHAMQKLNDGV